MSNPNRSKGHNFERAVVTLFKEKGYSKSVTTRQVSKSLDDCGIDILGTPFLIQCKAGYNKKNILFQSEYDNTYSQLTKLFGEKKSFDLLEKYPYILIRKFDMNGGRKRHKKLTTVTLTLDDFLNILTKDKQEEEVITLL